jgi:hypothetical protein
VAGGFDLGGSAEDGVLAEAVAAYLLRALANGRPGPDITRRRTPDGLLSKVSGAFFVVWRVRVWSGALRNTGSAPPARQRFVVIVVTGNPNRRSA